MFYLHELSQAASKGNSDTADFDSFEEVIREEQRVMKMSYELKLSKIYEQNSRLQLEHQQQYRYVFLIEVSV